MSEKKETVTLEKIHKAAVQEFLQKGFQSASLRNIVKTVGMTTGAFYGYYRSKEELFEALVHEQAEYVLHISEEAIKGIEELPGEMQTQQMLICSNDMIEVILNYIYEHYDIFKLILLCSEGTRYADFIHQLVMIEEKSTYAYIETLRQMGHSVGNINKKLIHMVSSGFFSGIFETIIHDMKKEEAKEYLMQFERFYAAGWEELLNIKFGKK